MTPLYYCFDTIFDAKPSELFVWHGQQSSMEKLIPKNQAKVTKYDELSSNNIIEFEIREFFGLIKMKWLAKIENVIINEEFTDIQIHGPFKHWRHRHRFIGLNNGECTKMRDEVSFLLHGGWFINVLFRKLVLMKLQKLFQFRHDVLKNEFSVSKYSLDKK